MTNSGYTICVYNFNAEILSVALLLQNDRVIAKCHSEQRSEEPNLMFKESQNSHRAHREYGEKYFCDL
jgi:hypothetical protein